MSEPIMFDKSRTALVVIDLQKGIVAMPTQPHAAGVVVSNAARLAGCFRQFQRPVFLVRVTPSADMKDRLAPFTDAVTPMPASMTTDWATLVPELGSEPADFIVTKRQWGAFYGTELDLQLRRRHVETIVLCGISTNIGVESTARCAYELGYQQIFAEDAMAARSAEEHEHTVRFIFPRMGRVRTTAKVLAGMNCA